MYVTKFRFILKKEEERFESSSNLITYPALGFITKFLHASVIIYGKEMK